MTKYEFLDKFFLDTLLHDAIAISIPLGDIKQSLGLQMYTKLNIEYFKQ